jgi:predicted RNase H-like nuclease (RuvC/YqgF family)
MTRGPRLFHLKVWGGCCEAFLDAGQKAMKNTQLDSRDRELGRLREKLGESTMDIELLREKIGRLETHRPFPHRRSRR